MAENPDLEKFIGENLINKIGIAILVAGIGYFVKFAIDQNWINELGRVLIGVLAGGLLLGLAHRLRNTFTAFSSVMVAGGLSVLYFTIAIAFSDYHIFSQTAAFLIMVVITGFAVLLSIAYNRVELAVMSLIGGFCTPFIVSTGQSNYVVLFSYVLILDCGMLILAYFKKWNVVHWVAYGFTVLLYGTWLTTEVLDTPATAPPYIGGLLFATGFYAVFMVMNLVYNLKNKLKFSAVDIILLLSNTAFYYAAGMLLLETVNQGAYQGLFTAALAIVNFGIAALLYRRGAVDRTLIYLLIGLVITFVSLTIPVQLSGNFITMFWALEAVLLLWLAQRSGLRLLATGAALVMALMLVSLMMDWSTLYLLDTGAPDSILPIVFNKAFITSLIAVLSLILTYLLLRKQEEPFQFWVGQLGVPVYQRIIGYLTVIVAYMAGYNEVDYQSMAASDYEASNLIVQGAYQLSFALVLLFIVRRLRVHSWVIQATLFSVLILLCYLVLFDPAVHELLLMYFVGSVNSLAAFSRSLPECGGRYWPAGPAVAHQAHAVAVFYAGVALVLRLYGGVRGQFGVVRAYRLFPASGTPPARINGSVQHLCCPTRCADGANHESRVADFVGRLRLCVYVRWPYQTKPAVPYSVAQFVCANPAETVLLRFRGHFGRRAHSRVHFRWGYCCSLFRLCTSASNA